MNAILVITVLDTQNILTKLIISVSHCVDRDHNLNLGFPCDIQTITHLILIFVTSHFKHFKHWCLPCLNVVCLVSKTCSPHSAVSPLLHCPHSTDHCWLHCSWSCPPLPGVSSVHCETWCGNSQIKVYLNKTDSSYAHIGLDRRNMRRNDQ